MQTKSIVMAIIVSIGLIFGAVILTTEPSGIPAGNEDIRGGVGEPVIENGVQYIDITARGGYSPRITKAKAGVPTVIRMATKNSYDCSIALVIPDIDYQEYLPQTGVTEIEVPAEKAVGTLQGLCSMAMYQFQIEFE